MLKYALIAGAAAAVLAIAWPLMTNIFSGGPNEATQLVEATGRTNNKAESLNDSFTDIIPPAPVRHTAPFILPASGGNSSRRLRPADSKRWSNHRTGRNQPLSNPRQVRRLRAPQRARRPGRHRVPQPAPAGA